MYLAVGFVTSVIVLLVVESSRAAERREAVRVAESVVMLDAAGLDIDIDWDGSHRSDPWGWVEGPCGLSRRFTFYVTDDGDAHVWAEHREQIALVVNGEVTANHSAAFDDYICGG